MNKFSSAANRSLSTNGRRAESKCHFFRIGYQNGSEKWIAFDGGSFSDLGVTKMKEQIVESEKKGSTRIVSLWYMGKMTLWGEGRRRASVKES
jgi:hypothetical protein